MLHKCPKLAIIGNEYLNIEFITTFKEKEMIRTLSFICIISFVLPNISWCDNTQQNLQIPVNTPHIASFQSSGNPPPASLNPSSPTASTHAINLATVTRPPQPTLATTAYVLMDGTTGKILVSFNPDQKVAH